MRRPTRGNSPGPAPAADASRAEYLADLDGLVYGEDPSEGFVRGRRFIASQARLHLLAPPGFSLDNTAQAVLGIKDGGGQALRLDVVRVPAEQSLADYLRSGWIDNVDVRSVEEFTVNGFPVAGAVASGEQWTFRLYAMRFGSDVYRFIFASKQRSLESDRAFREAVNSFRRMSLKEAREVRPLRIKIVTVKAGETVQSLTHRMAAIDKPAERLRVINGLGPHEQPKPGEQIKLLVE